MESVPLCFPVLKYVVFFTYDNRIKKTVLRVVQDFV